MKIQDSALKVNNNIPAFWSKMQLLKTPSLLTTIFALSSFSALADDDRLDSLFSLSLAELQQVTVSVASGNQEVVKDAPAAVTVIKEAEWLAMGAVSLAEVLETVAGIHVGMSKSALGTDIYSVRGMQSDLNGQVLILIDGDVLRSTTGGSTSLGFKKRLHDLKQIEIIRGPYSTLYGADGFSGIINLVSKDANTQTTQAGIYLGSFDTQQMWMNVPATLGNFTSLLSFNLSQSDDDKNRLVASDLQTTLDQIFSTQASQAPGNLNQNYDALEFNWQLKGERVQAKLWHNWHKQGLGPGAAQALDNGGYVKAGITKASFNLDTSEWLSKKSELSVAFQRTTINTQYNIFPAGALLPIGADGNLDFVSPTTVALFTDGYIGNPGKTSDTLQLNFTSFHPLNNKHLFRWQIGGEYREEDAYETKNFGPGILDGTETIVDGTLTNVDNSESLYAIDVFEHFIFTSIQDQWKINDELQVVIGVRYDNYESFGSQLTPRFSIVWQPTQKLTAKVNYGEGYRAPTANERYFRNNPVTIGNVNIKPEHIDSFEAQVDYQWQENLLTRFGVFRYKAKDLIEYVFNPQTNESIAQNIGVQSGKGFEFTTMWQPIDHLKVEINYAFIDAENTVNEQVPYIANKQGYVAINWSPAPEWHLHLRQHLINDRQRSSLDPRQPIKDFQQSYAKIQRSNLIHGLDLAIIAKNLFDQQAKEPSNGTIPGDYPLPGRQILMQLSYQF